MGVFSGGGVFSPERAATGGLHEEDISSEQADKWWNKSQDIVDPLDLTGRKAAQAQERAEALAYETLGMQKDWMDYIKSEYAPYSEVAREALTAQRGLAGLGGPEAQTQMISDIRADPFYQAKVGAGEEAVLRGASATGGLRSGDASAALAAQNQMLLDQEIGQRYNRLAGLSGQGFMGQEAGTRYGGAALGEITGTLGTIGSGMAAAQAAEADKQSGLMGLAGGVLSAFSDGRLKTNIREIGSRSGLPWYKWVWNDTAGRKFGLRGEAVGFMADDVEQKFPELVIMRDGYKTVVYGGVA